jgi:hypothetical protein
MHRIGGTRSPSKLLGTTRYKTQQLQKTKEQTSKVTAAVVNRRIAEHT